MLKGLKKKVEGWWNLFVIQERPDYILACKLKLPKTKLKEWNASNDGNLKKKTNLHNQTSSMDLVQEQRPLNEDDCWKKLAYTWNFKFLETFQGLMKRKY